MGKLHKFIIFPVVLATFSIMAYGNTAAAQTIEINSKLKSDPLLLSGKSGGKQHSSCGYVSTQPSKKIKLNQSLLYLRISVKGDGQPTLLIDGPGGRFCILADNFSKENPEISGYWDKGEYSLYIGEQSQSQYNYTLSISQQKIVEKSNSRTKNIE